MNKKILLCLLLVFPLFAFAQGGSRLDGKVLDNESRKGVDGVHIVIKELSKGTFSDSEGLYSFGNIPNGEYTLSISAIGYETQQQKVELDKNTLLNFYLSKDMGDLSEVIVTGTRTRKTLENTPILTKLVQGDELRKAGAITALDALEYAMPGVQFMPDAHGDNLQIQGLDNKYVLVLLDGERLVGETRANVNFDRISAYDIKQIEIINGASSVLYGSNAIGGVINIITNSNDKPWLQANAGVRLAKYNDLTTNVAVGMKKEKLRFDLSAFRRSTDGYDLTPEASPGIYTVKPFEDYSGKLKVGYDFSDRFKVNANFTYYRHELSNPPKSPLSAHSLNKNYTAGFQTLWKTSEKNSIEIKLHTDRYNKYTVYEKLDSVPKNAENNYNVLKISDTYFINENTNIIGGIEYNYESILSDLFDAKRALKTKKVADFNAFTQIDHHINKDLELVAGARYTKHENFGGNFTSSFALLYKLGNLKFRGNIASGYRTPSLKEMYYDFDHGGMFWIFGNPDLKPEKSLYTGISAEYGIPKFNVTVNMYKNSVEDKISLLRRIRKGGTELHHVNYNEARIKGLEAYVKFTLLKQFKGQLGYAYADAEDVKTGLQLGGNSKNTYTAGLVWNYSHRNYPFSISINGKGTSGMIYERVKTERDPATGKRKEIIEKEKSNSHSIWKLTYSQDIKVLKKIDLTVFGSVQNLFNYTEKKYLINPGRTYLVGLQVFLNK